MIESIEINFSFGKLARELPKIIEKHMQRTARSSAQGSKEAIDAGKFKKLQKSTIDIRKKRGTGGSKPLYETGSLYRSIKATSEGLKMNRYGIYHHEGFVTGNKSMIPNTRVNPRPFIQTSGKTILKSLDAFKRDFNRALRK